MWVFKIGEGKIPQLAPFLYGVNIIQSTVVVGDLLKIRRCHSQDMFFPKREPGAWEKFLCNSCNIFIGAFLRLQRDVLNSRSIPTQHHRLQIEPSARRQEIMAQAEEVVIDAVLLSRLILLHRAEMLERTDADNAIKRSKGIDCDLFPVLDIDLKTGSLTPLRLFSG